MERRSFPEYFPEGCPPAEAKPEELQVYRFCRDSPPAERDFLPNCILMPKKDFGTDLKQYGISVISDPEDVKRMPEILPSIRKKYKYVASGVTLSSLGVIQRTPSDNCPSHITWWLFVDAKPHNSFEICGKVS